MADVCEIKGPLGFLVLWIISKKSSNGVEVAVDIEKRRGCKPSPGTIYPVLKEHKKKGLIKSDKDGRYSLTILGKKELKRHSKMCCKLFYDMDEIEKYAK